jgi:hypothetical protein
MRRLKSNEEMVALLRARAKAVAGQKTKRATMWKQLDYLTRYHEERERVQRHYCTVFGFWRYCGVKPCCWPRACTGNADACLKRWVEKVPSKELRQAHNELLKATPPGIGEPELEVRRTEPTRFWRRPVDPAVQDALARAKAQRELEKQFGIGVGLD